jgi:hypothetical protein
VALGGRVEGATLVAHQLRAALADRPHVSIWPPPESGSRPLDVNDTALLDAWLAKQLDYWTRIRGVDGQPSSAPRGSRRCHRRRGTTRGFPGECTEQTVLGWVGKDQQSAFAGDGLANTRSTAGAAPFPRRPEAA